MKVFGGSSVARFDMPTTEDFTWDGLAARPDDGTPVKDTIKEGAAQKESEGSLVRTVEYLHARELLEHGHRPAGRIRQDCQPEDAFDDWPPWRALAVKKFNRVRLPVNIACHIVRNDRIARGFSANGAQRCPQLRDEPLVEKSERTERQQ